MTTKQKSYSSFTNKDIKNLGIEMVAAQLFPVIDDTAIEISDWLNTTLERNLRRPLASEKAKSEHLIVPILSELQEKYPVFTYFSGYNFDVDKKLGLVGFCDFILSKKSNAVFIESPILAVVEAKNADIDAGIAQCISELYAADIYNKRDNVDIPTLYGAVTTGYEWRFIRFQNMVAEIDTTIYSIKNLKELLAAFKGIL
jgi:hypothetical protein